MTTDTPFDRRLKRLRRDRASLRFAEADFLYRRMIEDILERLSLVKREFSEALVLGHPDALLANELRKRGARVTAADPGLAFAKGAGVQCDEDMLPFANGAFDLVICVGLLDSVNDLPGALILMRRVLRPDGLFLAAMTGAGSLPRLRSALFAADLAQSGASSPRIHPQVDVRAAGDLLVRAGFALPVVDTDKINVSYSSLVKLVNDLRAMAGTNLLQARAKTPLMRLAVAAAYNDFSLPEESHVRIVETFNIIHLLGWAPSPDQPQPAQRGSATQSLAQGLKRQA